MREEESLKSDDDPFRRWNLRNSFVLVLVGFYHCFDAVLERRSSSRRSCESLLGDVVVMLRWSVVHPLTAQARNLPFTMFVVFNKYQQLSLSLDSSFLISASDTSFSMSEVDCHVLLERGTPNTSLYFQRVGVGNWVWVFFLTVRVVVSCV